MTAFFPNRMSLDFPHQFAYLSHFLANPLSIFIDISLDPTNVSKAHFDALRNTTSFQVLVETAVEKQDAKTAKALLTDDAALLKTVQHWVKSGSVEMSKMAVAAKILAKIQQSLPMSNRNKISEIYIAAMRPGFASSPSLSNTMMWMKRQPSDQMMATLDSIRPLISALGSESVHTAFQQLDDFLAAHVKTHTAAAAATGTDEGIPSLRSEFGIRNESVRTTVVSQKVGLSTQRSTLNESELVYSKRLVTFHIQLKAHFQDSLRNPRKLPFYEVFFFDYRSVHRSAFMPRTRGAIERALTSPHDYLNCDCCRLPDHVAPGEVWLRWRWGGGSFCHDIVAW